MTIPIGEAVGDRSVIPAGRRYGLRVRMAAPRAVALDGRGELPRLAGPHDTRAGWWVDEGDFIVSACPTSPANPSR